MYIFKSDPSDGSDDSLLKSSKSPLSTSQSAEGLLARLQSPIVPAQIASLSTPLPTGILLSNLGDAVALAGVISSIGQPANQAYASAVSQNAVQAQAQVAAEEKLSKDVLGILASTSSNVLPISSLSDVVIGHSQIAPVENTALQGLASFAAANIANVTDLSILPPGAPVLITGLSDGVSGVSAVTVINDAAGNIRITGFKQAAAVSETFINTGLGVMTVTTPATNVSSLSLTGKVEFTATGIEVTSGITVSGESDSSDVALYITGGASRLTGSTDVINLGDGNNFIFNAGDGAIFVNLGAGANTVILAGVGANGVVNLVSDDYGTADMVAIAANGLSSAAALATVPLVTITGLNGGDAISFLSDLGSDLIWAGGSAQGAQVQAVSGDTANLTSWIAAAQTQANQAHSVAWFQFDGATYILETVSGVAQNGDTLVKLTGTMNLADTQVELSQGLLQIVS